MFPVYLGLAADYRIRHIRTPEREGGGRGGGRKRDLFPVPVETSISEGTLSELMKVIMSTR
jgi:hypothetical protein